MEAAPSWKNGAEIVRQFALSQADYALITSALPKPYNMAKEEEEWTQIHERNMQRIQPIPPEILEGIE